ncbi:MAG TPA: hypothetical protein PK213_09870, partial [Deltaproteobacteria bacterium]|nr:hypothetical protein [Deltaproteobacteria bacterium]
MLTCISLVYLTVRSAEAGRESRLLAAVSITVLLWSIADIGAYILPSPELVAMLSPVASLAFFMLPVTLHLASTSLNAPGSRIVPWAAYAVTVLVIAASWVTPLLRIDLFASALALAGAGYVVYCFRIQAPRPGPGEPHARGALLAAGSALLLVLLCLNPFLKDLFAPLSLSFVPVILMALGLAARPETTGRTVPGIGSLLKVLVISLAMLPLVCDVIFLSMNGHLMQPGELTPWLFHRVIITVVSLFIAGVFACLSFRKAEKRTDALLFSILCLLVCAVNFRDIIVAG